MSLVRFGYGIAVALWAASLALPAAVVDGTLRLTGYRVFVIGIDALSAGIPGWLANPLCAAAVVAGVLRRPGLATALAGAAVLLAASSFRAPAMARASGAPIETVTFEAGFFLWLAACSLIFATSLIGLLRAAAPVAGR